MNGIAGDPSSSVSSTGRYIASHAVHFVERNRERENCRAVQSYMYLYPRPTAISAFSRFIILERCGDDDDDAATPTKSTACSIAGNLDEFFGRDSRRSYLLC